MKMFYSFISELDICKKVLMFLILLQMFPAVGNAAFSLSEKDEKEINVFLLETIYWQQYWFHVWNDDAFEKILKDKKIKAFIAPERNDPDYLEVFVPEMNSSIELSKDGNDLICFGVESNETEATFESAVSDRTEIELNVSGREKEVLDFGPFGKEKTKFIIRKLSEVLKNSRGDVVPNSFDVKVGNYNENYPDIYFYIVGTSYHGYMILNVETKKVLLKDVEYNGDQPISDSILNEIKRIDETGKVFRFRNEKLEEVK